MVDALAILYGPDFQEKRKGTSRPRKDHKTNKASSINKTFKSPLQLKENVTLIDLRPALNFNAQHLPGAVNMPLKSLTQNNSSPFANAEVLEAQWHELENIFKPGETSTAALLMTYLQARLVVVVCFDGDTSRVATSVLRAKNIEAISIKDGMRGEPASMVDGMQSS